MTKIDIYRDESKNIVKFVMNGHAEYSEQNDIVCSALSAASNLVLNGLESIVGIQFGYETDDGYVMMVLPDDLTDTIRNDVNILLDSFYLFLQNLEHEYSENILISELEV